MINTSYTSAPLPPHTPLIEATPSEHTAQEADPTHQIETQRPTATPLERTPVAVQDQAKKIQQALTRQQIAKIIQDNSWNIPAFYHYTLRQLIFFHLSTIALPILNQRQMPNKLAPFDERQMALTILSASLAFIHIDGESKELVQTQAKKAINTIHSIVQKRAPWLPSINELLDKHEFFPSSIASLCQIEQIDHIPNSTVRTILISHDILLRLEITPLTAACCTQLIDGAFRMWNGLPLSKVRRKQFQEIRKLWNKSADINRVAQDLEKKFYRALSDAIRDLDKPTNNRTTRALIENISNTLTPYADLSIKGFIQQKAVLERALQSLPKETELIPTVSGQISPAQELISFSILDSIKKNIKTLQTHIHFHLVKEQCYLQTLPEDLLGLQLSLTPQNTQDAYSEADDEELLQLLQPKDSQESSKCIPTPARKKHKIAKKSSQPSPVHEEESDKPSQERPQLPSPYQYIELFLAQLPTVGSPLEIPKKLTHFSTLHRSMLTRSKSPILFPSLDGIHASGYSARVKGLFNHLFLSSCGFELVSKLFSQNRFDLLSAVVPMWTADRYLMMELYGNAQCILQQKDIPERHSLLTLEPLLASHKPLSEEQHRYLTDLSYGIFWYRYPIIGATTPEVEHLTSSNRLSLEQLKLEPGERREFIDFIFEKQKKSLELFYNTLLPSQSEEHSAHTFELIEHNLETWKQGMLQIPPSTAILSQPLEGIPFLHSLLDTCTQSLRALQGRPNSLQKQQIIREIQLHLVRLSNTLEIAYLFPEPHLFAFYLRNLFNVQWLVEQMYQLCSLIQNCHIDHTHNFQAYETAFNKQATGRQVPPLECFFEYNFGISLHYEELLEKPIHAFNEYKLILENCIAESTCDADFRPIDLRPIDAHERFRYHANRIIEMLSNKLTALLEIATRS